MSKTSSATPYKLALIQKLSSKTPVFTPGTTPSDTPLRSSSRTRSDSRQETLVMEETRTEPPADHVETHPEQQQSAGKIETKPVEETKSSPVICKKNTKKKHDHKQKSKHSKKHRKHESSSDSTSSDSEDEESLSDESSSSSSSSSSEDERSAKRRTRKLKALKKKMKQKKKAQKQKTRKSRRRDQSDSESMSDDSDSSDSDSSSSFEDHKSKKYKKVPRRKVQYDSEVEDKSNCSDDDEEEERLHAQLAAIQLKKRIAAQMAQSRSARSSEKKRLAKLERLEDKNKKKKKSKVTKRGATLEYKRVDQLWDTTIHDYTIKESAEDVGDEFDHYVFTVRRRFDWENKYKNTVVDIKSKLLKLALQEVMKDVKGVSLVEEQPSVDPNMLFMYLGELRDYGKIELKAKIKSEKKRKIKRRYKMMKSHVKLLIAYLDKDYEETKKTLYPMLKAGNITFDLLWALFKPNSIAYTTTYGSNEHPRCFKVDYATKECSLMRGEWYCIEGRYLEYDGKSCGLGDFEVDVDTFKGPRKITSLSTYPLAYHQDPEGISKRLIERGRHFVSLEGMNYRFHNGLAFMKKKKTVAKVNIQGRIMIDPAIFRRINPNYPISFIKPKDRDDLFDCGGSDDGDSSCGCSDSDEEEAHGSGGRQLENIGYVTRTRLVVDKNGEPRLVQYVVDQDGCEIPGERIDKLLKETDPTVKREYSDEELLIASPVVLGFAFNEKLWLEFTISGIKDIEWNEGAFESLVLPPNQKSIVKALVESHKFHAAETIDDVVQGKGKGLVAVLHGSPGTGKTLTAEGIAELLKCPLYMVSAGELGTDPRILEQELQKILDIAHSWGAVLLLDEADVFLEKREVHDIHRNALVSIFLRLLEYFQGILFLTTNRVETFDDAFQSRIHIALRYGELNGKAKKAVWRMFLEKVMAMEGVASETFKEAELEMLSRNNLNGRQIKNAVRTAQALAVNEGKKLSMEHIKRVLDVAESFEQDLKGGSGYKDAMRFYT